MSAHAKTLYFFVHHWERPRKDYKSVPWAKVHWKWWSDPLTLPLKPKEKLVWLYLLSASSHEDQEGFAAINRDLFELHTAMRPAELRAIISQLEEIRAVTALSRTDYERRTVPSIRKVINEVTGTSGTDTRFLNLPGASNEEWERLFNEMPKPVKFDIGIPDLEFEFSFFQAATNSGTHGRHLLNNLVFEREIQGIFPGETQGSIDFTKSYCRLFLNQWRGIVTMAACIEAYAAHGKSVPGYAYEDFKAWLLGEWWKWFRDPVTLERPKFLKYSGTDPILIELGHNISSSP